MRIYLVRILSKLRRLSLTNSLKCHLCKDVKELQDSHIIPRSYFKPLKDESGQLLVVSSNKLIGMKVSNADPKEKLLCWDCEQLICNNYEAYGTRLFKDYSFFGSFLCTSKEMIARHGDRCMDAVY